ncbi:MAG TPA: DUF2235 domain-containing protein [Pseudorhodoplanes sp.]|nr:DUF2235 domain-containing protein [Pseudorhodoplanes sp.]
MPKEDEIKARKIVLLSDGTGNAASSVWRTNVWRLFQSLDLTSDLQVAKYDDGVGSSSFVPLAIVGGVFGFGLRRNVIDLYKFVCRNYQEDSATRKRSEIYAFGFSRGAFTIRVLTALILQQGLVKYTSEMSESELHARATAAYRAYRADGPKTVFRIERLFWAIRDAIAAMKSKKPYSKDDNRVVPTVAFLGLWDTVAAYGLPIDEMTRGVSRWLWPLELPNRVLSDRVVCARHALALDDERTTFHPVLWTEKDEKPAKPDKNGRRWIKDERLSQVWFVGMHANVGGGYPDDALAHIPLVWIAKEAERCGLAFKTDPDAFKPMRAGCDKDGRIYNSRSGLGGYYRYGPRKIVDLCLATSSDPREDVYIEVPKIHESAFKRIASDRNAYAPIGFPGKYAVVTDDDAPGGCNEILLKNNPYEKTQEQIDRRFLLQERLWNYVWMRRVVYFLTVAASIHLVAFWLFHSKDKEDEFTSSIRLVSETVRLVESLLPGWFHWWADVYATNPWWLVGGVAVLALFITTGSYLGSKIADEMRVIWVSKGERSDVPDSTTQRAIQWFRTWGIYQWFLRFMKFKAVPLVSVLVLVWFGLGVLSHTLFNVVDSTGYFCRGTDRLKYPKPGESYYAKFDIKSICSPTGIYLDKNNEYLVSIEVTSGWKDGGIDTSPAGFRGWRLDSYAHRAIMTVALPFRRVLFRRWFVLIARGGDKGVSEYFLDPYAIDGAKTKFKASFKAERDDELFLYVNDVVTPLRFVTQWLFYDNNKGAATIVIERKLSRDQQYRCCQPEPVPK